MNLVRAISLSRGAADLQGDDSTKLICRVQLIVLAVDFVFNILADTFLRDPLLLLVIFICQVFLLVVGFIFYMMASANQAMKEGIHEKLLRHHQVTGALWISYFSLLLWFYILSLKRSWPSAGDHFSFTFHRDMTVREVTTINPVLDRGIPVMNGSILGLPEVELPPVAQNEEVGTGINGTGAEDKTDSRRTRHAWDAFPWASTLLQNMDLPNGTRDKDMNGVDDRVNRTLKQELKFFWSPGFIALYVAERSVSLLFYTANILGTLHILNTHLGDDDDYGPGNDKGSHGAKRKENGGRESIISLKQKFKFESPRRRNPDDHVYFESDSNLDDNGDSFIRQLEDQDGDPFENEQYNYSYRYGGGGNVRPAFRSGRNLHLNHHNNNAVTETETDEGEASFRDGHFQLDPRSNEHHRHHERRRRKASSSGSSGKGLGGKGKSKQKVKSGGGGGGGAAAAPAKEKKTKGSLRNMMIMAHLGKSASLADGQPWSGDDSNKGNFTRRKDMSSPTYRRMPSSGDLNAVHTMTTSASVEMIGTGSTDELLVAQVVNVHDGYSNPWIASEEKLEGDKRERTDSV